MDDDAECLGIEQDARGVDLEALRYNMSLTIEERLDRHRRAYENFMLLREVYERTRSDQVSDRSE